MNRRDFLGALLALGSSVAIPFESLLAAPESVIDQAWAVAMEEPAYFYVRDYGILTTVPLYDIWPSSRSALYGIEIPTHFEEVLALAQKHISVSSRVDDFLSDANVSTGAELGGGARYELLNEVRAWLGGMPNHFDDEPMDLIGLGGQNSALYFFKGDFEFCEELGVVITESQTTDCSYFGAELRIPVEQANERAEAVGIPIRFTRLGF